MGEWLLISRETTKTELSKEEVLSASSELEDRSDSVPERCWRYELRSRLWRHQVDFVASPPEYEVVERKYVSWLWLPACFLAYTGLVALEEVLATLVCGVLYVGLFSVLFLDRGPLQSFWEDSDSSGPDLVPWISFLIVLLLGVVVDALVEPSGVVAVGSSVVVFGSYWLAKDRVIAFSESWQEWIVGRSQGLPHIVIDYPIFVLMVSAPLFVFSFISYSPWILRTLASDVLVLAAYVLLSSVAWAGAVWVTYRKSHRYTRASYSSDGQKKARRVKLVSAVFAVVVSLLFARVGLLFLERAAVLFSVDALSGVLIGVSGGWPLLFLGVGLVYQYVGLSRTVLNSVVRGENRSEFREEFELKADVYVLEDDRPVLGALSTGFFEFVVVSEPVIEELSGDELQAVLTHEEGHIVRGDARVAFLTAVLSPVILTGKNVLFAALGFGRREMAADRYAAEKVGSTEQVIDALDAVEDLELRSVAGSGVGAVPTMNSFGSLVGEDVSLFEQVFGFFYGDFGLTEAHPSMEEREEALRGMED